MLEKTVTHLCLIIFFALTYSYAKAEVEISPIVVTADKIKSTLDKSPSDITVFEKKDIEKASSINELLSSHSDFQIAQSGPIGGNTSLFLRGSDSSHTLVVIDGMTMNDPSNPNRQFDLGKLSLNNIERIEVLKGSQGLLYGSNAIGGVIVITTKKAGTGTSGSGFVDYGSFKTFNSGVNVQQKIQSTGLSFGIDHLKTRGFSAANKNSNPNADEDGEKRTTLSGSLIHPLHSNGDLVLNYRYVNDEIDLDKGGGMGNDDPNDSQLTEQNFMKAGYNHRWSSAETQMHFAKTLHHRSLYVVSDNLHPDQSTVTTKGEIDTISVNHTQYISETLTQNINFDYQHEKDQSKKSNENLSFFFYNKFESGRNIYNLGVRQDSNQSFGGHTTYKAAFLRDFDVAIFKLSYSTGFRAPSLNQLFDPTYGNKNLKPEESQSAETGLVVPFLERHKYTGTVFYTELQNRLSYDPNTFINQNRGKARIIGFENHFALNLNENFDIGTAATWLSARDLSAKSKLARRANLKSKAYINFKHGRYSVALEGEYVGKRPDVNNLGRSVEMPSYTLLNASFFYELNRAFSSYVKIKNALSKDYEEVFGYGTGGTSITLGLKAIF